MIGTLSDEGEIEVRRLLFLEIEEKVQYKPLGPYYHTYRYASGTEDRVPYTLDDFSEVPQKPDRPFEEAEPDTVLYALWERYNLYQVVLDHRRKQLVQLQGYLNEVAFYILSTCISEDDRARLRTPEDYFEVYRLALFGS